MDKGLNFLKKIDPSTLLDRRILSHYGKLTQWSTSYYFKQLLNIYFSAIKLQMETIPLEEGERRLISYLKKNPDIVDFYGLELLLQQASLLKLNKLALFLYGDGTKNNPPPQFVDRILSEAPKYALLGFAFRLLELGHPSGLRAIEEIIRNDKKEALFYGLDRRRKETTGLSHYLKKWVLSDAIPQEIKPPFHQLYVDIQNKLRKELPLIYRENTVHGGMLTILLTADSDIKSFNKK